MKINKNTIGFVVLIVVLLASSVFSLGLFRREMAAHDKLDVNTFPMTMGEWKGKELPITEKEYAILETRNLISREYTNPSGDKLYLLVIYSETNRSVFHPPEVCMMGSGLSITDKQLENFDAGKKSFTTNKLFAEKGPYKEIILNCYKAGDIYTSNFYLQQTRLAVHQIFGQNVPGATLRVSMAAGNDPAATLAILKEFLSRSAVILDKLSS
ncbi:MAG: EpsI family protein [Candidatus Omnitrophica bacterium]|nr:EpsI family protein [Candidatus Omnitrophota bacterium]